MDQGSFDISLKRAEQGKVVTRFPPEPSGCLHIGHAKAVLLNQYFAQKYGGKLIVRFDDTNPAKESIEFEETILKDLELLGVCGDLYSHTSDYFDQIIEQGDRLVAMGHAYVDDTLVEEMRKSRFDGTASRNRELPIEENQRIFGEMKRGNMTEYCLRAKISVDNKNKALRDPVLFRCKVDVPHPRVQFKYKVYPTYDFACPIVDVIEGVTHALRTNEYCDRNAQYKWILEKLGLDAPEIWEYSRLNFVNSILSKRKLTMLVTENLVDGWNDPRLPTIQGILRRGMTVEALRRYILMQGPSKNTLLLEWDKIWALNRKHIDPVSPRYTALISKDLVVVELRGSANNVVPHLEQKPVPLHKKNENLGQKFVVYHQKIYISQEDASTLRQGEQITLMNWGNVIIDSIEQNEGTVSRICGQLHLEGDFKLTEKKLTWIAQTDHMVSLSLHDYGPLLSKRKLEDGDNFRDFLTPEYVTKAVGEPALDSIAPGAIIQVERDGFYICDEKSDKGIIKLVRIPDGKTKNK